jgi:hypothetical protein
VLAPRAVVPRGRKLWLALRALVGVPLGRLRAPGSGRRLAPARAWPLLAPAPAPFLQLPGEERPHVQRPC